MKCPLCHHTEHELFLEKKQRTFYNCQKCSLVFVSKEDHLSALDEKKVYDQHENSPTDLGYRNFLSRIFFPINERVKPNSKGLDFGSGSGPTLSVMLEEAGHYVDLYDHYYAQNNKVFFQKYDFIVSTEVIEHLSDPWFELDRLFSMLNDGGYIGFMTKLSTGKVAFKTWHYKNDPTHISFYSEKTFRWLAKKFSMSVEFIGNDVIILKKENVTQ